jgi:hypothetical protein
VCSSDLRYDMDPQNTGSSINYLCKPKTGKGLHPFLF